MPTRIYERIDSPFGRKVLRILDSYASLLALLLVNFFMLELIDDPRWGAVVSTLLGAVALVIAISDPDAGEQVSHRQARADPRVRAARAGRARHELDGGARRSRTCCRWRCSCARRCRSRSSASCGIAA